MIRSLLLLLFVVIAALAALSIAGLLGVLAGRATSVRDASRLSLRDLVLGAAIGVAGGQVGVIAAAAIGFVWRPAVQALVPVALLSALLAGFVWVRRCLPRST